MHFYLVQTEVLLAARTAIEQAGGSVRYTNRSGKQYAKVERPKDWTSLKTKELLRQFFPYMITTSSGYSDTTFRINPEI